MARRERGKIVKVTFKDQKPFYAVKQQVCTFLRSWKDTGHYYDISGGGTSSDIYYIKEYCKCNTLQQAEELLKTLNSPLLVIEEIDVPVEKMETLLEEG